jgi:hypothetical protein
LPAFSPVIHPLIREDRCAMVLEEQRLLHEDLERLEQAIADRLMEEPKHVQLFATPLIIELINV